MNQVRRLFYHDFQEHDHADTDAGADQAGLHVLKGFTSGICPNCNNLFAKYHNLMPDSFMTEDDRYFDGQRWLYFCRACGWWQCKQEYDLKEYIVNFAYQYHSVLETIDITGNEVKIDMLKKHLLDNWNDRRYISASKAEDLVKGILQEHLSCDVFHTTTNVNTPDGGIDLYVCHDNGMIKTAIQVKRRINDKPESLHEVRNFLGAMVIEGYSKGIFVTTAERFTKDVYDIPGKLINKQTKLTLDLIDGERLLDIIKSTTPVLPKYPLGLSDTTVWEDSTKQSYLTREIFQVLP